MSTAPVTNGLEHVDVLIVGAGISGIAAAYSLSTQHADKTFAILEARGASGGTWDLFRYPGIRSDSDLHTFSYEFKPWRNKKAIAGAPAILDYLRETAANPVTRVDAGYISSGPIHIHVTGHIAHLAPNGSAEPWLAPCHE